MMLTRCQEVVERLTDYIEGVLPLVEERAVSLHLGECDGCTTYLQQVRSTVAALRLLGSPD